MLVAGSVGKMHWHAAAISKCWCLLSTSSLSSPPPLLTGLQVSQASIPTHHIPEGDPEFLIFLPLPSRCFGSRQALPCPASVVLGIEPRALYLLGEHSTSCTTSLTLLMENSICDSY